MTDIKALIEKIINPPGLLKKNRRALFDTIKDIGELVKKDALTAFNAHFPYLADSKKLQEHGDALLIPHLLHDTEAEYRERVATASFFLMKAGERQYIMGQLEERFKTRYTIIEAFLNIHLKVTDLSADERAWALELLDSLLNPVISTELSEWFHFIDEVIMADAALYSAEKQDIDFFDDAVLRDGRILRDGKTAFNKTITILRNGAWKRNGRYGRSGTYTFPATDMVRRERRNSKIYRDEIISTSETFPARRDGVWKRDGLHDRSGFYTVPRTETLRIYYGTSYRDPLYTSVQMPMSDTRHGMRLRDGSRKRDGSYLRLYAIAYDKTPPLQVTNTEIENFPSGEKYLARVFKNMGDTHKGGILRDGSRLRNGMLQRANIVDEAYLTYGAPMLDRESVFERTSEAYTVTPLVETETINETAQAVMTNDFSETHITSIRRNGAYRRDGLLQRANIQDTAGMKYRTAAAVETARYRTARNGMVKRDGSETRSGFGFSGIYEDGKSVITLPVERDVLEARDAALQSAIANNTSDIFKNTRRRDGAVARNGRARRSNFIIDAFSVNYATAAMRESASIDEVFSVGTRKHLVRAGLYLRNGSVLRNNNVLVPLAE